MSNVSAIISTYTNADDIIKKIESVFNQSFSWITDSSKKT
jgi:hypothetical protein